MLNNSVWLKSSPKHTTENLHMSNTPSAQILRDLEKDFKGADGKPEGAGSGEALEVGIIPSLLHVYISGVPIHFHRALACLAWIRLSGALVGEVERYSYLICLLEPS